MEETKGETSRNKVPLEDQLYAQDLTDLEKKLKRTLIIIASHDNRIQCWLANMKLTALYQTVINETSKIEANNSEVPSVAPVKPVNASTKFFPKLNLRFKNCAILKIYCFKDSHIWVHLVYEGSSQTGKEEQYYVNKPGVNDFGMRRYEVKFDLNCVFFLMCNAEASHSTNLTIKRDTKLTFNGVEQAKKAAKYFIGPRLFIDIDTLCFFSSDLRRTTDTLSTIKIEFDNAIEKQKNLIWFVLPCSHEVSYGKKDCDQRESFKITKLKQLFALENIPVQDNFNANNVTHGIDEEMYKQFYKTFRRNSVNRQRCRDTNMLTFACDILMTQFNENHGSSVGNKWKHETDDQDTINNREAIKEFKRKKAAVTRIQAISRAFNTRRLQKKHAANTAIKMEAEKAQGGKKRTRRRKTKKVFRFN